MRSLLIAYAAGALIALWRADGPLPTKLALALLWPVGPLAFVLTITGLVAAAAVSLVLPGPRRPA
jgi:hypothetical protein